MNKLKLVGLWSVAAASLIAAGCSDDSITSSVNGQGRISPAVDVNRSILAAADAPSAKSRAEAEDVSAGDLQLTIKSADGAVSKTWASLADYDNPEFPVGIYTVAASYGSEDSEGFEAPYFYGESQVRVRDGETASTGVTAALANCRFAFSYTDAFTGYVADWSADVHSAGGNYFTVGKDETRPVYVRPGQVKISVHIVKPNGKEATVEVATVDAEARHHYNVKIDLNGGQGAGEAVLVVEFDDTLETEPVEIELSDELFNVAGPELTAVGFTSGEPIKYIIGETFEGSIHADIIARAGIKAVTMTSKASTLVAAGWPAEIDLMQVSADRQQALEALGLNVRGLWKNPDKIAVIDFSGVVANIKESNTGVNLNEFTLTVTDANGRVSEPITLAIDAEKLNLTLSDPSALLFGAETMQWTVGYNGSDLQKNVKIQYLNDLGNWADCEITAVEAAGDGSYRVTVALPDATADHVFRATGSGLATDEVPVTVVVPEFSLNADERNVFARHAEVTVDCTGSEADAVAASAKIEISTDGGNTFAPVARKASRASSSTIKLNNLQPATAYTVRASIGSVTHTVAFTTEAADQIPNGDMEQWARTDGASHWNLYYPASDAASSVWGTNNPMTTSQGGNYGYCRVSGTESASGRNGNCAVIRTQGWGSGNTAVGSCEKETGLARTKLKYLDAGLLHLGSSRSARPEGYSDLVGPLTTSDLDCGLAFASRPSSISFWYKYEPKNEADHGVAEIALYDAQGNVLGSATIDLPKADSFTQKTFEFNYPLNTAKAAKIYVKFLSTYSADFLQKKDAYIKAPAYGNITTDQYVGSKLYIDDIELTY